ncbi:MAG: DNA polymerase III subunit beta [Syntrophorhabdales bacterium]|jgi:DNA polymerase-3 subunit beta
MNIIIEKGLLLTPLTKLVNITEHRSIMPILTNILITFSPEKIDIYSTDLELSAISHVAYQGDMAKKIVVHGRKFLEILKEMDSDSIDLEIHDTTMTMKQKQTEFVLSLQDPEEFPEVREITGPHEFSLSGATFLEMLDKVGFAISSDETRYVLTGMYVTGSEGRISVVGTDGFRMSLYQHEVEGVKGFEGIIVPKRSIVEIARMVGGDDEVKLVVGEKHVQFSTPSVTVVSRLLEGSFPDYENVVPRNNANVLTIDKAKFIKGLRKVATIISKSEPVKVTFSEGAMEFETESEIGRAKEVLAVDYSGENLTMNFNIRFLMDVAGHIDGENIVIRAPSTYGAVLFEGEKEGNYRNIVMPIRV